MTDKPEKIPTLPLTHRELQVLILMLDCKHNKEIADILTMSEHTAKFHVNSIMLKTKQTTRLGAVLFGLKFGIIKLNGLKVDDGTTAAPPKPHYDQT